MCSTTTVLGFGLSYTTFACSNLRLSGAKITDQETSQGISTGEPLCSTTTVLGLAPATASMSLFWQCGHLAETFPVKLSDNPSYLYYGGEGNEADYREGVRSFRRGCRCWSR